ncbi:MAG: DUF3798 domain-containing protein, partial [Deltaproteobacteria bacterium]|nr:DUF3798 domain-containing protein [Deltaproteobacteria bacterium]
MQDEDGRSGNAPSGKGGSFWKAAGALAAAAAALAGAAAVLDAPGDMPAPGTAPAETRGHAPVRDAPFRIAVVTPADAEDEDLLTGMEIIYAKYGMASGGGYIAHSFFPESSMSEPPAAALAVERAASDPRVAAVVVTEGLPGTAAAFRNIRARRPEVKLLAADCREDTGLVAAAADLAVNPDFISRGYAIPWAARGMGAKSLVHASFPRHMSVESIFRRRVIMEEAARDLGLRFHYENVPDPTAEGGVRAARDFVELSMRSWLRAYGRDAAFFTTSKALAAPVIRSVLELGGIFVEADEPSPFLGFPEALELPPGDAEAGRDHLMRSIESAIVSMGAGGRLGTWSASARQSKLLAMTELAMKAVTGEADPRDPANVDAAFDRTAPGSDWKITRYSDGDGTVLENVFLVFQDTYVFGRGRIGTTHLDIPGKYRAMAAGAAVPHGAAGEGAGPGGREPSDFSGFGRRRGDLSGRSRGRSPGPAVLVITGSSGRTPQERQGALAALRAGDGGGGGGPGARHLAMPDEVFDLPAD